MKEVYESTALIANRPVFEYYQTWGLLGLLNGISSDDLTAPDGSSVTYSDHTLTARDASSIYYQFGERC